MSHLVFIGGFGSNRTQVDLVADTLSEHYEQPVIGVAFSEAQRNLAETAQLVREGILITHSAGMLLSEDMTPKELIAVAPPVPTNLPLVAWRSVLKTVALIKSGHAEEERARKVQSYHKRVFREHIFQPHYNVAQAMRITRFDPARLAVKMVNRGVTVTLAFMKDDHLYPQSKQFVPVDIARQHGAIIHEGIEGHHDEFLLYPLKVLEQVNRS